MTKTLKTAWRAPGDGYPVGQLVRWIGLDAAWLELDGRDRLKTDLAIIAAGRPGTYDRRRVIEALARVGIRGLRPEPAPPSGLPGGAAMKDSAQMKDICLCGHGREAHAMRFGLCAYCKDVRSGREISDFTARPGVCDRFTWDPKAEH